MNRRKRILLVDDEAAFTRLLKRGLEADGVYDVQVAASAPVAVKAAQAFQPDLVLLDVVLADETGFDVSAQLQSHASLREVPVVFLTAMVKSPPRGMKTQERGGFTFLAKPSTLEDIVSCIERNLRT